VAPGSRRILRSAAGANDFEDSVRFWALRLRELRMAKSSPDEIIATNTDTRFLKEVRKELGI
jgi:NitT/TauT family transport system substrate-binding protein